MYRMKDLIKIGNGFALASILVLSVVPEVSAEESSDAVIEKLAPLPEIPVPEDNPMSDEKVELGKMLYFDTRLSGDSSISCSKCHNPDTGFTEPNELSTSYPGTKHWRHTPTVLNAAYAEHFFWDGRAGSLEEQALGPIQAPIEMNQNLAHLEAKLSQIPEYVKRFKAVFNAPPNRDDLAKAIAAFERTIVSTNVPLDEFLKGDEDAMDDQQVRGMKLFEGKAGCIKCHGGAILSDQKFHVTGVPETEALQKESDRIAMRQFFARDSGLEDYDKTDRDHGRFFNSKNEKEKGAFKTPSLREVTITAPYMHNGAFKTLEEVVDFYNKGGGEHPNKDPLLKPLNLTDQEKEDLIAFLDALTGDPIEIEEPDLTLVTKGDGSY